MSDRHPYADHGPYDNPAEQPSGPRLIGHSPHHEEPTLDPRLAPSVEIVTGLTAAQAQAEDLRANLAERMQDDPLGAMRQIEDAFALVAQAAAESGSAQDQAREYLTRLPAEMAELRRAYMVACRNDPGARKLLPVAYKGSIPKGIARGYFKSPLTGGTFGYLQRRPDDCVQAALASYLQVPPYVVPAFDVDRLIAAGKDPEEIERISGGKVGRWLDKNAVTLVSHPTRLPVAAARWIGLLGGKDDDPTANAHALLMDGRTVIFDTAWLVPPRKDEPVSQYALDDIEVGFTIERR